MIAKDFMRAVTNGRIDIVALLSEILAETGAAHCVIGGLAVNAYAEPVVSLDLDLVVVTDGLAAVREAARARGLVVTEHEHSVNLTAAGSDLRIQLQTDPRYQAFLSRAGEREILGYRLRVAAAEDVLQGKLWAHADPTRRRSKRQKDLADILRLVESRPDLEALLPPDLRTEAD